MKVSKIDTRIFWGVMVKIYFDESGNSGCVIPNKKDEFYSDGQRFFVLCGIIVKDKKDEKCLKDKYSDFKKNFSITDELKGSDLLTKERNAELNYFIENMLDDEHFYVCIYDKIFYLATLVSNYFFGNEIRSFEPLFFYTQTSCLVVEDIAFFKKFYEAVSANTDEKKEEFLKYVMDFDYKHVPAENNGYREMAKLMLENQNYGDFILPYGSYVNKDITNLINLTALGETLLSIKIDKQDSFQGCTVVHDKIKEFETEFEDTFNEYKAGLIDLKFEDSKNDLLIQYADNVASIFRKAFTKTVEIFTEKSQWKSVNQYFLEKLAELLNKISINKCKFDTAINDWALAFCVRDMFSKSFEKTNRNNRELNVRYIYYQNMIANHIRSCNFNVGL